jgi:acyl carrier protein
MDADLYDELQMDSIDAVDLLVQLKELTGEKIAPEKFREVRTIGDVLDALTAL